MRGPSATIPDQEDLTAAYPQPEPRDSIRDMHTRPTMVDSDATQVSAFDPTGYMSTEAHAPRAEGELGTRSDQSPVHSQHPQHVPHAEALPPIATMEAEALPASSERGYSAVKSAQAAGQVGALRSNRARLVWGSVLVGCALAVTFLLLNRTDLFGARWVAHSPWSHLHQIMTQQVTRLATNTNATQAKSELIDLHVEVVPATARLFLDGREASNPLKVSYPADGKTHELRCSADGFKTRVQQVRFDRSVSVLIGLVPLPSPGSGLRDDPSGAVQVGARD